jgi:hypothetical protein
MAYTIIVMLTWIPKRGNVSLSSSWEVTDFAKAVALSSKYP